MAPVWPGSFRKRRVLRCNSLGRGGGSPAGEVKVFQALQDDGSRTGAGAGGSSPPARSQTRVTGFGHDLSVERDRELFTFDPEFHGEWLANRECLLERCILHVGQRCERI